MSRLPSGYQELSYIQSTGTQYINTGIKPNNLNSTGIKIEYSSNSTDDYPWIFGAENSDNTNRYGIWQSSSTLAPRYGAYSQSLSYTRGTTKHVAEFRDGSIFYDNVSVGTGGTVYTINYNIFLSAINKAGSATGDGDNGKCKLYYCEITENHILVRNLIPCKRLSDSAIGMYDLVSQTFFGNAGTGTFIAGVPVIEPTWGSGLASVNKSAIIRRRGLIVSSQYAPTKNDTILYITTTQSNQSVSVILYASIADDVTIYWGDGETTGISSTSQLSYSHAYTNSIGDKFTIIIAPNDGMITFADYTCVSPSNTLEKVIFGIKSLTQFSGGNGSFRSCASLKEVYFNDGITTVGKWRDGYNWGVGVFSSCSNLEKVYIPSSLVNWHDENNFKYCQKLKTFGKVGTNCNIEYGGTTFGGKLNGTNYLERATFDTDLTSIRSYAFANCSALSEIHCQRATPPTIQSNTFTNLPSTCVIYVPTGSLSAYQSATNWSTYSAQMQEE